MSSEKRGKQPHCLFPSAHSDLSNKKHTQKKGEHKRCRSSSSDSDSSDGGQWVEKQPAADATAPQPVLPPDEKQPLAQRDDWMTIAGLLGGETAGDVRQRRRQTKQEARAEEERRRDATLEALRYRDSGSTPARAVGDGGASWLRRALERAHQQAREQGLPVEDIVAERWGSMEKLQAMLDAAEQRARPSEADSVERRSRPGSTKGWRRGGDKDRGNNRDRGLGRDHDRQRGRSKGRDESGNRDRRRSRSRERRSRSKERKRSRSRERRRSRSRERKGRSRSREKERNSSGGRENVRNRSRERKRSGSEERNRGRSRDMDSTVHRKRHIDENYDTSREKSKRLDKSSSPNEWHQDPREAPRLADVPPPGSSSSVGGAQKQSSHHATHPSSGRDASSEDTTTEPVQPLTEGQLNTLAARLLKAELNDDDRLAATLRWQLDAARKLRAASGPDRVQQVVVVAAGAKPAGARAGGKRKKADTHRASERTRYFADDDQLDLRDMFERERRTTPADEAAAMTRLAAHGIRQKLDDDFTVDDALVERAGHAEPTRAQDERQAGRVLAQHRRADRCDRCFDNRHTLKHLIVSLGEKVYLSLPAGRSLTTGHCLVVPQQHVPSLVALDEDAWEEVGRFRAALVNMFAGNDKDVMFFETAMRLAQHPHAVLHCVPVPRETGDMAPIYFRKALEESEAEWSQNKKVVDLRGRDVRRAVPKGLPYFFVDFGLQSGFAHIVEDEELFPGSFAQEVIGGMLELEPSAWRKSRHESLDQQIAKVKEFSKDWITHDFTQG